MISLTNSTDNIKLIKIFWGFSGFSGILLASLRALVIGKI